MADAKHKSEHEKEAKHETHQEEALREMFSHSPEHATPLHPLGHSPEHHTELHAPEHASKSNSVETLAEKVKHLETRLKEIEKHLHKDVEHAIDEQTARQEGRPIVG